MAERQRSNIPQELRSLFPTRWLNATARDVGLVERRRKVAPAAFFWAIVLGFAVGHRRSIASLRRFYRATTGTALVPSSFYDWFTDATVRFLKRALARAVERLAEPSGELREHLSRFKDLVVADATVIRLRDALAGAYAACRTNHTLAAMKLHLVMSVFGAAPRRTAGRDGLKHVIEVEDVTAADRRLSYPLCFAGARACPPDDWGAGRYEDLLGVLASPEHEEHDELLAWVGGHFDPEGFDANAVNRLLRGDA